MRPSRAVKAALNVTEPPIALRVISATASPTPQNFASSSMPSSLMTVLSTSKQTASALRKISFISMIEDILLGTFSMVVSFEILDVSASYLLTGAKRRIREVLQSHRCKSTK
uniref:Uncharacterized protein n=1 Tax=Micrurus spixii TaxID=129469 RepID=A0A2D4LMU9_9SAUR